MSQSKPDSGCSCHALPANLNRRQLLHGSMALAAAPLCCTTEEAPAASFTWEGSTLVIDLDRVPQLGKAGGAVKVIDMARKVNLIVLRPEKQMFAALDRSCTHGGAQVSYNRYNRTVQCTSWGHSEFAVDGAVLGGSAKKPLKAYEVRRSGNRLEVLGVVS